MSKSGLTKSKIFYEFDPFEEVGMKPPANASRIVKEEIRDYVKEQVLSYIGEGKSPISGGAWKRSLSPEYKKIKKEFSSSLFANMELKGDMLDALAVTSKSGTKLSLEITGADEVAKADGHNNFSGKSSLPPREFIPKSGETFKAAILDGIKAIIKRHGK